MGFKNIYIITNLIILIALPANAHLMHDMQWAECEEEVRHREFPRACMVIGVKSNKIGFHVFHQKIQRYCLEYIEHWTPLSRADEMILNAYYPECAYRYSKSLKYLNDKIKISEERTEMVRFLYMNTVNDESNTDSKKLSNTFKAGTRPK